MPPHRHEAAKQLPSKIPRDVEHLDPRASPSKTNTATAIIKTVTASSNTVGSDSAAGQASHSSSTAISANNTKIGPKRATTFNAAPTRPPITPITINRARTTSLTIIEPTFGPRSPPLISRTPSFAIAEQPLCPGSASTPRPGSSAQHSPTDFTSQSTSPDQSPSLCNNSTSSFLSTTNTTSTSPLSTSALPPWTPALHDRLILVQRCKWQAQKRWSASQELWEKEESALLDARDAHKAAVKKARKQGAVEHVRAETRVKEAFVRGGKKKLMRGRGSLVGDGCGGGEGAVEKEEDAAVGFVGGDGLPGAAGSQSPRRPSLPSTRRNSSLSGLIRKISLTKRRDSDVK